uniref:Glutathione transferase n=1 Tax=Ciona savignyi TaxID=51511 RepID=H2Z453_CIOSA
FDIKMVLKVFLDYMSQPCRAIDMFMNMSNIPFKVKQIALRRGEHKQESFLKLHPLGQVPVLQDGDFVLTESIAMVRYLSSIHTGTRTLYPTDVKQRAKIDEYLEWQHLQTRFISASLFQIEDLKLRVGNLKRAVEAVDDMLSKFEMMFLKDNDFVVGNTLTVADLFALCELIQPTRIGRDIFVGHPRARAWFERAKAASQPYFDSAHAVFHASQKKM